MIFVAGITVFSSVIIVLVIGLLFVEAKILKKEVCDITINENENSKISTTAGQTLLSSLVNNGVFIPSACGGRAA